MTNPRLDSFPTVIGIIVSAVLVGGFFAGVAYYLTQRVDIDRTQERLAPFYLPPDLSDATPGDLLRFEPMGVDISGGDAYRILYATAMSDGTVVASSGMAFLSQAPAQESGRPVMAWAHGTVGQGVECAPSRSADPTSQLATFLPQMMELGWAVVATDYYGLGTPGIQRYLIAGQEARDVIYSVRALAKLPDANTSQKWGVYGHSQGGHSSIWTGHLAKDLAPELTLVGVAAAAPAAELSQIIEAQWESVVGWVIGAEVMRSWPLEYPLLPVNPVLTPEAQNALESLATECIKDAGLEGTIRRNIYGQNFFSTNPLNSPEWVAALTAQTPSPLPADMPFFLAQGTADEVVLAEPNAFLQETWCTAGSMLTSLWMGGVGHQTAGLDAGPSVVRWMWERFEGIPATRTCDLAPPVSNSVVAPAPS